MEIEKSKTFTLNTPIESNDGSTRYETINLKEPVLFQVEQFYAEQAKSPSSLPAMRLLIVLVSGIPDPIIKKCLLQTLRFVGIIYKVFGIQSLGEWQQLAAEATYFYKWGPHEAWSLTKSRLLWWVDNANRIINRGKHGE